MGRTANEPFWGQTKISKRWALVIASAVVIVLVVGITLLAISRLEAQRAYEADQIAEKELRAEEVAAASLLMKDAKLCVQDRSAYNASADGNSIWFQDGTPTGNLLDYHDGIKRDIGVGCVLDAIDAPSSVADSMWANRKNLGSYSDYWGVWEISWEMSAQGDLEVTLDIVP